MLCMSTSSATLKAASRGILGTISRSLSFSTMMVVSQYSCSLCRPRSALSVRSLPSARKGMVTTPMTSEPERRAISAT